MALTKSGLEGGLQMLCSVFLLEFIFYLIIKDTYLSECGPSVLLLHVLGGGSMVLADF